MEGEHRQTDQIGSLIGISSSLSKKFVEVHEAAQKELGPNVFIIASHFDKIVFGGSPHSRQYKVTDEAQSDKKEGKEKADSA